MAVSVKRPIHTLKKIPVLGRPVHNVKVLFESDKMEKVSKKKGHKIP